MYTCHEEIQQNVQVFDFGILRKPWYLNKEVTDQA